MPWTTWRNWRVPTTPWDEVAFWALDLEATGLDPSRDALLSVGMVPIRDGTIRFGERWHTHVRVPEGVRSTGSALRVHQILPAETREAPPLADVLRGVLDRLAGGVLLVHVAEVDVVWLRDACRRTGLAWPSPYVVDTAKLVWRLHRRARFVQPDAPEPDVRLEAVRARCGLPPHVAHDALGDALATAELFLLLRSRLDLGTLRQLI